MKITDRRASRHGAIPAPFYSRGRSLGRGDEHSRQNWDHPAGCDTPRARPSRSAHVVGFTSAGSVGAKAGVPSNCRIVKVNGDAVKSKAQIVAALSKVDKSARSVTFVFATRA